MSWLVVATLALPAAGAVATVAVRGDRAGRIAGTAFAALAFVASVLLVTGDRTGLAAPS